MAEKYYCEYCNGVTTDDIRGNCRACGGPRQRNAYYSPFYYHSESVQDALSISADGSIYIGGVFSIVGGADRTRYVAKWNGSAWAAIG